MNNHADYLIVHVADHYRSGHRNLIGRFPINERTKAPPNELSAKATRGHVMSTMGGERPLRGFCGSGYRRSRADQHR